MKNLTKIFMAVVAGMFAFSCVTDTTSDPTFEVGNEGVTELSVSLEASRTQLGEKGDDGKYLLYWSEGDAIAVNGVASNPLAGVAEESASATFRFPQVLKHPYSVIYPAPAADLEAVTEGCYPVVIPETQAYTEGTFAPNVAPMYGSTTEEGGAIELHHLTGILRIAPKGNGEKVTGVTVKAEKGRLAGTFDVNCATGELTAQAGASNSIAVTFAEPLVLKAEATPIYVAVPAGSFGTVAITLTTEEHGKMIVRFDSDAKPINHSTVRELNEFPFTANYSSEDDTTFEIDGVDALLQFAKIAGNFYPHTEAVVTKSFSMEGVEWTPIEGFNGYTFNGGDFAITGLSAPLFGTTSSAIHNVKLESVNIASNGRLVLGAVACTLSANGSISDCHTSGTITVSNPDAVIAEGVNMYETITYGGIVGLSDGDITKCHNEINITINQVAKSDNAVVLHPSTGGIVGYSRGGAVTNCVNGNEAKTTGAINYHDNQTALLYVPHVAGIAGLRASTNTETDLTGNNNYGAISYKANGAGSNAINYNSINVAGVVGYSRGNVANNDNYGTITVADCDVKALYVGGVIGVVVPNTPVKENHNHTGANITVNDDFTYYCLTVAGVASGLNGGLNDADGGGLFNCSNDGAIDIKASTSSSIALSELNYYRIGGVIGYINRSVNGCENKANGDITLEGNIVLTRSNKQSGYNVAGVYAYQSTQGGQIENNINRGDINVYTNVSKHTSATASQTAYYKLDIGGISAHTQHPLAGKVENFGNITIGKADGTEMGITANNIYIAGGIANRHDRSNGTTGYVVNHGDITINSGVTMSASTLGIYIGGCAANSVKTCNYHNYSNEGDITIKGKLDDTAYIGGVLGYSYGPMTNCTNTGAVTTASTAHITGVARIAGVAGHATGNLEGAKNNAGGNVTVEGEIGDDAYIGGVTGYVNSYVTNCENSAAVATTSTANITGIARIGGVAGHATGNLEGVKNNTGGNVTVEGTFSEQVHSGGITAYYGKDADDKATLTMTSCENHGNVTLNATTNEKLATYLGGLAAEFFGTAVTGCKNSGDITLTKCSSKSQPDSDDEDDKADEVWVNLGGFYGYARTAHTLTNCTNSGTISSSKSYTLACVFTAGGFIGGSKTNITLDNCQNTMKQGVEWGIKLENTISNGNGSNQSRAGGFLGWHSGGVLTTKNGVSNSANIYIGIINKDTGGSSYGGIAGVAPGNAHSFGGTVSNSGNIYYAGTSHAGTFAIGGLFGQTGNKAPTVCEDLRNTGNITITNEGGTNWKPTAKKNGLVGGIAGIHSVALSNARSVGTITAIGFEDTHLTSYYNSVGAITGSLTSANLTNCHAGGTMILSKKTTTVGGNEEEGEEGVEVEVDVPGALTVANYAAYLSGDHTFTSATAKSQNCGFITAIDDTTPEYAN